MQLIAKTQEPDSGILFIAEAPQLAIVLGYQWQLDVLALVTDEERPSLKRVVGIDITFNCTEFYVAALVYQHPLIMKDSGKAPYIIGPLLISNCQKTAVFETFAHAVKLAAPQLRDCKIIIGSDSQLAMFNGFKEVFRNAELILCTKHLRDNIERQLSKISDDSSGAKRIVNDIFHGKDCVINLEEEEFEDGLESRREEWEKVVPGFHAWFMKSQAKRFKQGAILPRRRAANVDVHEPFYNNPNESINKILRKGCSAKTSIPNFKSHYDKEVGMQKRDIERSIKQDGLYMIRPAFKAEFERVGDEWKKMSVEAKTAHLKRFWIGPKREKITSQSMIKVTPKTRLSAIGNSPRKSRKKSQKPRMRASRHRCTSLLHKRLDHMYLKRASHITTNSSRCQGCQLVIDTSTTKDLLACCLKLIPSDGSKENKFRTLHAHLACIHKCPELYRRKLHLCNDIEAVLSKDQHQLIAHYMP